MSLFEILPAFVGYIMCGLAIIHALLDARENRVQRFLMIITLFAFGFLLEYMGVISGNYVYGSEAVMLLGVIPLSITFAWVGIIYSAMIIGECLKLSLWQRILTTTITAVIVVIISIIFFHFRILGEEKRLTEQYGDSYLEYKRKIPRYFLFI